MARSLHVRHLEPELLDVLPPAHAEAVGSRRDLVWVNALMFQPLIMRRLLARHLRQPPRRILEIGAGDGRFMFAVAKRMARRWPGVELVLLDRAPVVSDTLRDQFAKLGWRAEAVVADVFDWAEKAGDERFDLVTANLFLHHCDDAALSRLFAMIAPRTALFAATEPWRAALPHFATRLLPAIGANRVTLHDAAASVRAGFSGKELTRLWPAGRGQVLGERRAGPFTHVFAATGAQ
jgi:2-polyprenyl-3-methyl-5-hydroxy-6-metoxy-1,4-benzoquinol methylase